MKIIVWIEYITTCLNAISKGAKIIIDNWPANIPNPDNEKRNEHNG
jgi:hypothetical protein